MPILSNPFDAPEAVRAREDQSDPLAMYLVVRRERINGLADLAVASARATLSVARLADKPDLAARFAAWYAGSFRKITLRAGERDWARLLEQESPLGLDDAADPCVAALPPLAKSARSGFLRGLQAYVLPTGELSSTELEIDLERPTLLLSVNPSLTMSAGKFAAQIGHAVLLARRAISELGAGEAWRASLAAWEAQGEAVAFVRSSVAGWAACLAERDCVVVTDSGLTEIEPGSHTIAALRPCADDELADALGLLRS
jgi:peptidyl-tRNA hydrolase